MNDADLNNYQWGIKVRMNGTSDDRYIPIDEPMTPSSLRNWEDIVERNNRMDIGTFVLVCRPYGEWSEYVR